jgi:2-phospho-L-lactate/phosphoenolpyruvate guanylyltransferase
MRTVAVLPIKRFARAKQRLRAGVDGPARERLAAAMAEDVLDALGVMAAIDRVVVVTAEDSVAAQAARAGALVIPDPDEAGQSAAAALGVLAATRELSAQRVLLVPGDTPGLDQADVEVLLARTEPVVIVPDRHGAGTNALALSPPGAIAPAFGPGSRARHEAAADAAGLERVTLALPSLTHDVDTPDDLAALRARGGLGPRTAALLAGLVLAGA